MEIKINSASKTPPTPNCNAHKFECKRRNKLQHAYNGNIDHDDDLTILQINTGNGTSKCNDDKKVPRTNGIQTHEARIDDTPSTIQPKTTRRPRL